MTSWHLQAVFATETNAVPRITTRTMTVLMILTARAVYWFIEQPTTSKLLLYPELVFLRELLEKKVMETHFIRLQGAYLQHGV